MCQRQRMQMPEAPENSTSRSNSNPRGGRITSGPQGEPTLIEQYEPLIRKILSDVPKDIRDDCYQAAVLGLLKAEKKKHKVKFYKSYVFRCMKNEVIKDIACLRVAGNGLFSLDKITFLLLSKFKRMKYSGEDITQMNLSEGREKDLEKLLQIRRI
jgi:hypothetical protein